MYASRRTTFRQTTFRQTRGPIGQRRQRGVVLVVALIFLILLTLLALSSSSSSLLQEKMVGGTRNAQLAQFGAESALRAAEARLWKARVDGKQKDFATCSNVSTGVCYRFSPKSPTADVTAFRTKPGWQSAGAQTYDNVDLTAASNDSATLAKNPVYIIQDMGLERPPGAGTLREYSKAGNGGGVRGFENHLYRITSRSVGGNDKSVVVLQSTFAARAN